MNLLQLHSCSLTHLHLPIKPNHTKISHQTTSFIPSSINIIPLLNFSRLKLSQCITGATQDQNSKTHNISSPEIEEENNDYDNETHDDGFWGKTQNAFGETEAGNDFDRNPEFAEIIGSFVDDPDKGRSKVEERLRNKKHKILQTKTGSAIPMKVTFNKFDFSNSYIWLEFHNIPLAKDISLICDTIRSWHIIGRLGGCNAMNMQLSHSPMDKRPSYDATQGANVTPTTFYNIGDFEVQDTLARIWVDIGSSEPLILDVLINALTQISSDYVGIKKIVFGGSEFENWKEDLKSEDAGYSSHRI